MTAMTARMETNIPEAPIDQHNSSSTTMRDRLTDTLDGPTEDEDWHALGDGTDETAEFEEEYGGEEDMFGFDDGEKLTDQ
jgi:hypothetical protein